MIFENHGPGERFTANQITIYERCPILPYLPRARIAARPPSVHSFFLAGEMLRTGDAFSSGTTILQGLGMP